VAASIGIDPAIHDVMLRSVMIDRAAELLGVSRRTVYYRIREGKLHTIRTPCNSQRVLLESLQALIDGERGRTTGPGSVVSDAECPRSSGRD
jgi:excisionase family DNA binding protein